MSQLLTPEEIQELTKAKQVAVQARILEQSGIYYIRRADGSIVTTWHHVNNPCRKQASNDDVPDFGAIA